MCDSSQGQTADKTWKSHGEVESNSGRSSRVAAMQKLFLLCVEDAGGKAVAQGTRPH